VDENTKQIHKYRPAEYVIMAFGGVRATARAIGYNPDSIIKWRRRKGFVPTSAQEVILKAAIENDVDITADDLILGREVVYEDPKVNA